jgi:CBS domain containing-hemolysin-like protein
MINIIIIIFVLLLSCFFSIWENSLLKIKRWEYLKLIQNRDSDKYQKLTYIESSIPILRNIKNIFFFIGFIIILIKLIGIIKPIILILIVAGSFIFIYFFLSFLITKDSSVIIIEKLLPFQAFLNRLFAKNKIEIKEPDDSDDFDDKIEAYLFEGKERNIITEEEEEMVEKILYFKERTAREIMTPRINIIGLDENSTLSELKTLIVRKKRSRILIYRKRIDNIVGIIIAKDVFRYWGQDSIIIKDTKSLIRKPVYVTEYMKISRLLKMLQRKKQKLAVVMDEYGGISGVVTVEDILEEIVGEIYDEYEKEEIMIEKFDDYYIVSGETPVEDIEDLLDTEFEMGQLAITIGGLINFILGKFPVKGEKLILNGYEFEVKDISEKNIEKVIIREKAEQS